MECKVCGTFSEEESILSQEKNDDGNHSEGKSVICVCRFRIVVILCTTYESDLDAGRGTSGCSLMQLSRMVDSTSYGIKSWKVKLSYYRPGHALRAPGIST